MLTYSIRNGQPGDAEALAAVQHRSLQRCPDMDPLPAGFFRNPGLENGRNLYCAVDSAGTVLGYGMVFNSGGDRRYCDIKIDPAEVADQAEDRILRDALLASVTARAQEMKSAAGLRDLLLYGCYFEHGYSSVAYLKSSGFALLEDEAGVLLTMNLRECVLPDPPAPAGVAVREWSLDTPEERHRYLAAHGQMLPMAPLTEENLEFLTANVRYWAIAAFDGDQVAGCVIATLRPGGEIFLDYVFVLPAYARRGIARYLVALVLHRLQTLGKETVRVETGAENLAALALYESVGFRRDRREVMMGIHI